MLIVPKQLLLGSNTLQLFEIIANSMVLQLGEDRLHVEKYFVN
jgi:hypothetical protein